MLGVALLFRWSLPALAPTDRPPFWIRQAALAGLWRSYPLFQRPCLCQALLFGCFMALWRSVALHLAAPPWRFGTALIGSFALVGLASIAAAPAIGQLVDKLGPDRIVLAGFVCCGGGVLLLGLLPQSLPALALGLQGCFVANQARIYGLNPATRCSMSGLPFSAPIWLPPRP